MKSKKENKIINLFNELTSSKIIYRSEENKNDYGFVLDINKWITENPVQFQEFENNPRQIWFLLLKEANEFLPSSPQKEISINLINIPKSVFMPFEKLRVEFLNKLVGLKGLVKQIGTIYSRIEQIDYECSNCGTIHKLEQDKSSLIKPARCSCGGKTFIELSRKFGDIQELLIEEDVSEIGTRQPLTMRVILNNRLCDTDFHRFQAGNKVEILGILEPLPLYILKKDDEINMNEQCLNAISIENKDYNLDDVIINEGELAKIKEIAQDNPLKKLADNLAPTIFGKDFEIIKKAIILYLAKGVKKEIPNGEKRRGEIHLLIVGDAGISKSAILQNVLKRVYNCRITDGKDTTKAGIVASVLKDKKSERYICEAGDMVLANGGYLLLDEADKLSQDDIKVLHRPLEQGEATISKAGIHITLKTETSLLAVANPKGAKFSLQLPLASQIDFSPTLMSRFDLIFLVVDKINGEEDNEKAKNILNVHMKKNQKSAELSPEFIKKYFFYISKLKPVLNEEASSLINEAYVKIRALTKNEGMPITLRALEGMIRLAEAHAKLRLSDIATKEDAQISIDLVKYSLKNVGIDNETNLIDMGRVYSKSIPISRVNFIEGIRIIKSLEAIEGKIDKEIIIKTFQEKLNIAEDYAKMLLDEMKKSLDVYEPEWNKISLTEKNK